MQFNNRSVYFYNYPTFNTSVFLQIIPNGVQKEFCVYFSQTEENQQFSDDVHTIHTIKCQFSNKRK